MDVLSLLHKYDVPGPRYTSYPTVPAWKPAVGPDDFVKSLGSLKAGAPLSLYNHLPFCENLCHFCGCMQVITKRHGRSEEYTRVLIQEIERVVASLPEGCRGVSQLHFGGGTPNFFRPEEMEEIMGTFRRHFKILPDAEVAVEMHPKTSTSTYCQALKQLGFNRISLGVQDFDPYVQQLISRNQTYEVTRDMVEELRGLGFRHFNFDLIYGLPGQSLEGFQRTLDLVLGLRPDRLAVYSYAHVPWVRPVQRSFKDEDIPPPEMKLKLFELAYQFLLANGYQLIGMDHFALQDDELAKALETKTIHRNFMGYSTRADAHQIGFGVSSISYVNGNYFQNNKELPAYYEKICAGQLATFRGYLVERDDKLRRDLITRIMCEMAVDFRDFEKKWQIRFQEYFATELPALQKFVEDGLAELTADQFQVKGQGRLFLRNMAMVFDRYLEPIRRNAINPVFSRTV